MSSAYLKKYIYNIEKKCQLVGKRKCNYLLGGLGKAFP